MKYRIQIEWVYYKLWIFQIKLWIEKINSDKKDNCYMKSMWNSNHLSKRWQSRIINVKTVEIVVCLSDLCARNAKTLWKRVFGCEMRPREMNEFVEQDMGWYRARFPLKHQTCNEFADAFTALTLHFEELQPSTVSCSLCMCEPRRLLSLVAARAHMRTKFKARATDDFKLSGLSDDIPRLFRVHTEWAET